MVVSLHVGGKSHVSNGQNVSFKEPCPNKPFSGAPVGGPAGERVAPAILVPSLVSTATEAMLPALSTWIRFDFHPLGDSSLSIVEHRSKMLFTLASASKLSKHLARNCCDQEECWLM